MAKEVTTVRLDKELLDRIDRVAEARGESRSITIERMLKNEVPGEEDFIQQMEQGLMRGLARVISSAPTAANFILWLAGESVSNTQLDRRLENLRAQIERGKQRQQSQLSSRNPTPKGSL